MAITLLVALIPFLAYQRFGPLGVLDNSDLASHLAFAEGQRTGDPPSGIAPSLAGYPLGPQSLVAVLATILRTDLLTAFNGLLLAIPMLTAVAALAGLHDGPLAARVPAAVVVGLPYLCAAYLIQGSFKETLQALMVLTFALTLREITRKGAWGARSLLPVGLLIAGSVLTYSPVGLIWPVAITVCWAVTHVAAKRRLPPLRQTIVATSAVAGVMLVATATYAGDLVEFSRSARVAAQTGTGGNVATDPPILEVLGLWPNDDFRDSEVPFTTGVLAGLALALALASLGWWRRRGDLTVPAGAIACLLVYAAALATATSYSSAKGLVIAAPLTMLLVVGWLAARVGGREESADRLALAARAALMVAFVGVALWSSVTTLRNARVGPDTHAAELRSMRPLVEDRQVLLLARDDYVIPELQGAEVSFDYVYSGQSVRLIRARPEKPFLLGAPRDFDSVDPETLDRFEFVITPRTSYASTPPSNWRLRRSTGSYRLFERRGPTHPRQVLNEDDAPGAFLNCADPAGLHIAEGGGTAAVGPAPVVGSPRGWTASGAPLREGRLAFAVMPIGRVATHSLSLAPGRWDISVQYVSPTAVRAHAPGLERTLPASLDPGDQFWPVGTIYTGGGTVPVSLTAEDLPDLASNREVAVGAIAATRSGATQRMVDLRNACGEYVDWYRSDAVVR